MPPGPSRRVTSRDVAARAGVSQATVSLVFSGAPPSRVGPATRERVLTAARALGYEPNVVARALVQGRSYTVGLVMPALRDPFFIDAATGAQRVLREQGYAVILAEAEESSAERTVAMLRARQIDGLLIDAMGISSMPADALDGVAVVLIDEPSSRWPGVVSDAEEAGRLAARHLVELGHRRIGFLGPLTDAHAFRLRERGFAGVLRLAGIAARSEHVCRIPATVDGGLDGMRSLLNDRSAPTAVFCANDLVALGALKACARSKRRVPRDVSIVGCDDIESAQLVTPELTTVAVRPRELGARAAKLLLDVIAGKSPRVRPKPLDVELKVRGTTAPTRARKTRLTTRPMMTRASTLRSTLEYLDREVDATTRETILAALPAAERAVVERAPEQEEVPYEVALHLWRAIDVALRTRDPQWMERMGAFAIERAADHIGDIFLHRPSPLAFLTQQVPLFRLYYRPGDMVVVDHGADHAIVRLVGFEPQDPLFCRRFTGGWTHALQITGGREVRIRHLRCACEGDLFCEWTLRWAQ
jgi:LacI family transcriptional regulator